MIVNVGVGAGTFGGAVGNAGAFANSGAIGTAGALAHSGSGNKGKVHGSLVDVHNLKLLNHLLEKALTNVQVSMGIFIREFLSVIVP